MAATQANLALLLGLESSASKDLKVEGSLDQAAPASYESMVQAMLDRHPSLRAQAAALKGAQAEVSRGKSSRYPDLSAEGSYHLGGAAGSAFDSRETGWSLGLNSSYNLFAGGGKEAG